MIIKFERAAFIPAKPNQFVALYRKAGEMFSVRATVEGGEVVSGLINGPRKAMSLDTDRHVALTAALNAAIAAA